MNTTNLAVVLDCTPYAVGLQVFIPTVRAILKGALEWNARILLKYKFLQLKKKRAVVRVDFLKFLLGSKGDCASFIDSFYLLDLIDR